MRVRLDAEPAELKQCFHNAGKLENSKYLHCDAMQTAILFYQWSALDRYYPVLWETLLQLSQSESVAINTINRRQ